MPLNSTPCTVYVAAFEAKRAALSAILHHGFRACGAASSRAIATRLADARRSGVVGFKAFLCDSGLPEFPRADDLTLYEGHAGGRAATASGRGPRRERGNHRRTRAAAFADPARATFATYLASRPVIAEVEAIQRAALLAREAGAWLHIVHVSSGRGVAAAAEARARGADVSIETCPHYLFFTEDDLERIGAVAKCAPPLRDRRGPRRALEAACCRRRSNRSPPTTRPAPPDMKCDADFFRVWGGIAGVQSTLAVLLEAGYHARGLALRDIVVA